MVEWEESINDFLGLVKHFSPGHSRMDMTFRGNLNGLNMAISDP
jgi:hypothetical protein